MAEPVPQPDRRCPLCGGPNDCAPAACGRFDVDCWCASVTVSREALARVPPALQGRACLCRRCATGTPCNDVTLSVHDGHPPEAERIDQGLGDFNQHAAPLHEVRPLACLARDGQGELLGGVVGRTWGACAELQQLWVAEDHRRRGLGARLVMAFEGRARERGCRTCYLETFSFQAPGLYRDLGYETTLAIEGFGHGLVKFTMLKTLD